MAQTHPLPQRIARLPAGARRQYGAGLQRLALAIVLPAALWVGYLWSSQPVTVVVNEQTYQVRTHHPGVAALVTELGLALAPEDIVEPPLEATLAPGDRLTIRLARPVIIEADQRTRQLLTHRQTVQEVLAASGLTINPRDKIFIEGELVSPQAALPEPEPLPAKAAYQRLLAATTPGGQLRAGRPAAVRLIVHRAIPVTLRDGPARSRFYTTQLTVGEALLEQGITVFLGDKVTPGLSTPLSPGMRIFVERSMPVTIEADGRTVKTRTHWKSVSEVLAHEGIILMGQDFSRPPGEAPIAENETIEILRVREAVEIEEELIPFETEWMADDELELDRQEIRRPGVTGIIRSRTRIRTENGQEVWREFEDEWLAQEPSDRLIAYGTNVVVRSTETADGPIEYWRKISMRASAYNAASSGKAPDHPRYGLTRIGVEAGYGVVAVDPRVIPLRTRLYIEGYGFALAGDTGSRILGKHIDLGYPDGEPLPSIFGWRDVYVLTPVPAEARIRYVLPQWPQR